MQVNDRQRVQAAKDIWRLMYERGVWRAEEAIDLYRREAEERLAVPGLFWYRAAGTLILMALGALVAVALGQCWVPRCFWQAATAGALGGLIGAIILWRQDVQE